MKKMLIFAALMVAVQCSFAGVNKDIILTIPTGQTAVTNDVVLWDGGVQLDHVIIYNGSDTTVTVAVSKVDGQVKTDLVAAANVATTANSVTYPRVAIVNGDVTNYLPYVVEKMRFIASMSATNAANKSVSVFVQSR